MANRFFTGFLVVLAITLYLQLSFLPLLGVSLGSSSGESNRTLIYTFSGEGLLVDPENFSIASLKLLYLGEIRQGFFHETLQILDYVKGTPLEQRMRKALEGVDEVYTYPSCRSTLWKTGKIGVERKNNTIFILLPAGPCVSTSFVPAFFKVYGTVETKLDGDNAYIRVVIHAKMPLEKRAASLVRVIGLSNSRSGLEAAKMLVEGKSITLIAEYRIQGGKVYQNGREIGFSPFYIVYPVNASQVRELVESGANKTYYGIPLSIYMEWEREEVHRYGKPPRILRYAVIVARLSHGSLYQQLLKTTRFLMSFGRPIFITAYRPQIYGADFFSLDPLDDRLFRLEIEALIGNPESVKVVEKCCKSWRISQIYSEGVSFEAQPAFYYHYHYPLGIFAPVVARVKETNETVGVFLSVGFSYPADIDPYSIDIGFYEPKHNVSLCDCSRIIGVLVVISSIGAITYIAWRMKMK